jgi:MFS family permease
VPASRRPPGARRRARTSGRTGPARAERGDTSPLAAPRPTTRPLPLAGAQPPPDEHPTDVIPDPAVPSNGQAAGNGQKVTVTRVAAARSKELTAAAARRVRAASRADGAGESGLTQLLWVNALHMAGDAMIAVSLAGTLFFAASTDAQRGNVALYLLVTMAPFAVLAPVIGPALDRLQRGRRWAIAASHLGRAFLALVMMTHFDDIWLYPAALGVLVLSKSHNVLRAAVVPRVLPQAMSLTSANARLSVFGLATAGVAGAIGAGIAAVLGFDWELGVTACVFVVAGAFAVRLPRHVDVPTGEQPADIFTTAEIPVPAGRRRRVSPHVVLALRANTALRGLGGFLTIFSAFLVQDSFDGGWEATLALGAIAAAAGVGSFAGTAAGSRLHHADPDRVVLISAAGATAVTVLAAFFFSFAMAVAVAGVAAITNALGKVSLDAIIQREVPENLRASAFARSETLLQLAWVIGGAFGIALPPTGWLGFTVAAALLVLAVGLIVWSLYRGGRPVPVAVSPDAPTGPVDRTWS